MQNKTGYFQDHNGNASSSRVLGFIVVIYALVLSTVVLILGYAEGSKVMLSSAAAGTIFTTIAAPALIYMFNVKKQEKEINTGKNQ